MDTESTAQSVSTTAIGGNVCVCCIMVAGGNVFVTAGGCDIVKKLHRKALHVDDDEVAEVRI